MSTETKVIARLLKNMAEATEGEPLSEAIEMYLLKRHRAKRRLRSHTISMVPRPRPHGRLSPSSLGGCKREAAFKFLGVEGQVKIDPDLELIFEDGNWRHHKWQALFLDMQAVLGRKNFRVVSFESDAILPKGCSSLARWTFTSSSEASTTSSTSRASTTSGSRGCASTRMHRCLST
jgi:hypothetical protein